VSVTGLRFAGTRALLVELSSLDSVLALHAHLLGSPLPGQIDVLAAASTVLIKCDTRAHALKARAAVERLKLGAAPAASGEIVEIPVNYDGEDLAEVARLTGLSAEGVVNAHTGQLWTAAFGGFAPGFAYLVGEDDVLDVPRRDTPRTAVPAGAVALAGGYSAVYPRKSPGGWQLIGHTSTAMWELDRADPALIRPQDRVRFVPARESIAAGFETAGLQEQRDPSQQSALQTAPPPRDEQAPQPPGTAGSALEVVSPGLRSLLQDLGRPGLGDLGVSASGAVDQSAARQANRLVGNGSGDSVIENLFGSVVLRARGDQVLAVTGARVELAISPSGRRPAQDGPFALLDGETLALGPATTGLQAYVGVRGGIEVEPVLGSRSTDTMSGLGPAALAAGSVLPVGVPTNRHVVGTPEPSALRIATGEAATLRVTAGPRDDWFGSSGLERLTGQKWLASSASDRIGLRLELPGNGSGIEIDTENDGDAQGPDGTAASAPLARIREGELKSEGVVAGSLQVPPSGLPVLFLADHPVTGGYPVIAAVVPEDLPVAAQLPPGTAIRFVLVDPDTLQPTGTPGATTSEEGPRP
jgi:KipI family sensor histidine kinase inhibitor